MLKSCLLFNTTLKYEIIKNLHRKIHLNNPTRRSLKQLNYVNEPHIVHGVYTESGAILPIPKWYKFGFFKVLTVVTLSLGLGALISKTGAEFLEDYEIFVPEEDD